MRQCYCRASCRFWNTSRTTPRSLRSRNSRTRWEWKLPKNTNAVLLYLTHITAPEYVDVDVSRCKKPVLSLVARSTRIFSPRWASRPAATRTLHPPSSWQRPVSSSTSWIPRCFVHVALLDCSYYTVHKVLVDFPGEEVYVEVAGDQRTGRVQHHFCRG